MSSGYPIPAVVAVVRGEGERILLLPEGDQWHLPAAPLTGGDRWEQSLERLLSAVGVRPTSRPQFIGLYSEPELALLGTAAHHLAVAFLLSGESMTGRFFIPANLPATVPTGHRTVLHDALARNGNEVVVR